MKNNLFRFLIVCLFACNHTFAADGSTGPGRFNFRQKVDKKEGSRWTLAEWLEQKERNQLMDLWLAMYAPSPYEFFVSVAQNANTSTSGSPEVQQKTASMTSSFGAFATVLGIEGQYENNVEEKYNDLTGILQLRIAGNAVQGTHLIAQYGLRTRNTTDDPKLRVNSPFLGADLNLYLNRYIGLSGNYRNYYSVEHDVLGTLSGIRTEYGLFLDFGAVRIFGHAFAETSQQSLNGIETQSKKSGSQVGLKFFF